MASLLHLAGAFFSMLAFINQAWGCTAFSFSGDGKIIAARSYDWRIKEGLIVKNPKGLQKTAYVSGKRQPGEPARWTARFGSISFNQYGREFPVGGMNEAGLVVEGLLVKGANYPAVDQRSFIQQGQWVQYLPPFNPSHGFRIASGCWRGTGRIRSGTRWNLPLTFCGNLSGRFPASGASSTNLQPGKSTCSHPAFLKYATSSLAGSTFHAAFRRRFKTFIAMIPGDIGGLFQSYDRRINSRQVRTVVAKTPVLKNIPPAALAPRIIYAELAACQGP